MKCTCVTRSEEETERVGTDLGHILRGCDLVLLSGDLGTGKSVLARGIAHALGATAWRGSPTFNIVHEYPTSPRFFHADFYRLTETEISELGLDESIDQGGVLVVEWPERSTAYLRAIATSRLFEVQLHVMSAHEREIQIQQHSSTIDDKRNP